MVIVTAYTLLVTLWYDVIFTFAKQLFDEVCWHNIRIILHAFSLLVVVQYASVMNTYYQHFKLWERCKTQHSAKTEQLITPKVSVNTLKQEIRTYSALRQRSSHSDPGT